MRTCRVVASDDYFPRAQFSRVSLSLCDGFFPFETHQVQVVAQPFNFSLLLDCLCVCLFVSQVWKEVQSWDSGHTGLRAAAEGKHRHPSTVEVCASVNLSVRCLCRCCGRDLSPLSLSRYDPSLWWCCHQCWLPPHHCSAAADILASTQPPLHRPAPLHRTTTLPRPLLPLSAATYTQPSSWAISYSHNCL